VPAAIFPISRIPVITDQHAIEPKPGAMVGRDGKVVDVRHGRGEATGPLYRKIVGINLKRTLTGHGNSGIYKKI
jgi:hypothetical protein